MESIINYDPSWITVSEDNILKRSGFACGLYKERYIVIAGGQKDQKLLRSAALFDIQAQTCISLPRLPFDGVCKGDVVDKYFYVMNVFGNQIYRINLSNRLEWEKVEQELKEIQNVIEAIVSDGDHLFILTERKMFCYDRMTSMIIDTSIIPIFRTAFSTAVVGNNIFVMGGFLNWQGISHTHTTVSVFNISTQIWSQAPPLPFALRYSAARSVLNRWIIVTGGDTNSEDFRNTKICIYDTLRQTWTVNNISKTPSRLGHDCIAWGSQVVIIGGLDVDDDGFTHHFYPMESIHVKHLIRDFTWESIKGYVLLRELLNDRRAYPIITNKKIKNDINSKFDEDKVIHRCITDVPLDVFRHVLTFLIEK